MWAGGALVVGYRAERAGRCLKKAGGQGGAAGGALWCAWGGNKGHCGARAQPQLPLFSSRNILPNTLNPELRASACVALNRSMVVVASRLLRRSSAPSKVG